MRFFFSRVGLQRFSKNGFHNISLRSIKRFENKTIPFTHIYASPDSCFQDLVKSLEAHDHLASIELVSKQANAKILQDQRFPKDLTEFNFDTFTGIQQCFAKKKTVSIVIFIKCTIGEAEQEQLELYLQRWMKLLSPIKFRFQIVLENDSSVLQFDNHSKNVFFHSACIPTNELMSASFYLEIDQFGKLPLANKWFNFKSESSGRVAVIIPHFGSQEKLNLCVTALLAVDGFDPRYLYIVDNNKNNHYFTRGVNHGLQQALADQCEYFWILNNDTQPKKHYLMACLNRFASNQQIGIIGGKNLVTDKPDRIFWGGSHQAFPSGVHKAGYVSKGSLNKASRESWATFSSVIIRRKTFEQCGLLDEKMRMIFSDSDFCFQAALHGWQTWYEPKAEILHDTGVSRKSDNAALKAIFRQDKIEFYRKWSALTETKDPQKLQQAIFKLIDFEGSIAKL